jgi:hypothetical protein
VEESLKEHTALFRGDDVSQVDGFVFFKCELTGIATAKNATAFVLFRA